MDPIPKPRFPARLVQMLRHNDVNVMHWSPAGKLVLLRESCAASIGAALGIQRKSSVMRQMKVYGFRRTTFWCADDMETYFIFRHPYFRRGSEDDVLWRHKHRLSRLSMRRAAPAFSASHKTSIQSKKPCKRDATTTTGCSGLKALYPPPDLVATWDDDTLMALRAPCPNA